MKSLKIPETIRKITHSLLSDKELAKKVVIKRGDGYYVYAKYRIMPEFDQWIVTKAQDTVFSLKFHNKTTAFLWCLLHMRGQISTAATLHHLERRLIDLQPKIEYDIFQLKKTPTFEKDGIIRAKLSENIRSRRIYQKQIKDLLNLAKYY